MTAPFTKVNRDEYYDRVVFNELALAWVERHVWIPKGVSTPPTHAPPAFMEAKALAGEPIFAKGDVGYTPWLKYMQQYIDGVGDIVAGRIYTDSKGWKDLLRNSVVFMGDEDLNMSGGFPAYQPVNGSGDKIWTLAITRDKIRQAIGFPNWRRRVQKDGDFLYGPIQKGDIFGWWILEDLQKAFSALSKVVATHDSYTFNASTGSREQVQTSYSTAEAALAAANSRLGGSGTGNVGGFPNATVTVSQVSSAPLFTAEVIKVNGRIQHRENLNQFRLNAADWELWLGIADVTGFMYSQFFDDVGTGYVLGVANKVVSGKRAKMGQPPIDQPTVPPDSWLTEPADMPVGSIPLFGSTGGGWSTGSVPYDQQSEIYGESINPFYLIYKPEFTNVGVEEAQ